MWTWLVACLGTVVTPNAPDPQTGIYGITLPSELQPVELESTKRASMFVAHYRNPASVSSQQVILSRPTRVSDAWTDGGLPPAALQTRTALMPLEYSETTWLGGPASVGQLTSPDGMQLYMWGAVRDGWLHELQCSVGADSDPSSCETIAASVKLTGTPIPAPPLPSTTRPEAASPLTIPTPEGWLRAPAAPASPERLLLAAPPPPTDPRGERPMGHLAVELYPDMKLLGSWVDALRQSYAETGRELVNQQSFEGPYGEAFRSEYSDGIATTFTFDYLTPAGMLHVECSDNVTRRTDLRVLCSRIHQGITIDAP